MLIKLSNEIYVAADDIAEITIDDSRSIIVRTKQGINHRIDAEYGRGIYDTFDKLVAKINAALSVQ